MDKCAILNFCLEIVSFLFSYKTSFIHLWLLFLEHLSIFYSSLSSHSLVRTTEHVYTVCTLHKVAQLKVKSTWLKQRSRTSHRAVNGSVSPEEGKEVGRKDPPPRPKGKVKFFPIQSCHSLGASPSLKSRYSHCKYFPHVQWSAITRPVWDHLSQWTILQEWCGYCESLIMSSKLLYCHPELHIT